MNLADLSTQQFYNNVGNQSQRDCGGNGVSKRHSGNGKKCRNQLGKIIPLNIFQRREHHSPDKDKGRRSSCRRDDLHERKGQDRKQEQDCGCKRGKACSSSGADSGDGFHVSGNRGCTTSRAGSCGDGIAHKCFFHTHRVSVSIFEVHLFGNADQSSQGVEHIYKGKGQHQN